ncbi:MAG TPA: hypothetical protein VFF29_03610 [Bacteroidota bacterium]|nr:hypothetical protein [Bacteroidota bacterium]
MYLHNRKVSIISFPFVGNFMHTTSSNAKQQIIKIITEQPEDSSYDEILRELAFDRMVERGLVDSDQQRTISNEEMRTRIRKWQK